ncbi:hypothetical protein F4778DRAFT_668673 [Xylariomycetidae sp. FL2044]|nr:hypothetical protein F4778DRAFT_668673 [Xylariomycetidae sp. FL2044]
MVKFIESDAMGLPLKRKQATEACTKCRKRKKRCMHTMEAQSERLPSPDISPAHDSGRASVKNRPQPTSASGTMPPEAPDLRMSGKHGTSEGHNSRFVGDSNPEAIFIQATNLCHGRRDASVRGGLGVWQSPSRSAELPLSTPPLRQAIQDILKSYARGNCLVCRPPESDSAVLRRIYLEKLHPIFPILPVENTSLYDDVTRIVLEQLVSLAAAADPEAVRYLRLNEGQVLPRSAFCASLSHAIQTTLDAGLITDRTLLCRIYGALSLYKQPTCPEEADVPALLNSRAVHQMQTLALHLVADEDHTSSRAVQTLFCCLWALDRLNAAFYGRSCLIHERDVGWNLEDCIRRQSPPFRLFLMIVSSLDKVIGLYRPSNKGDRETFIELPIFEQMILDAHAARIPNSCLASLEIFYHSVAILSSQSPADGASSALPTPATNSRRSLAADRITSIVGNEFAGQLAYLPIIPFGVSLSLSVSYRKMRHSNIAMFRNRGKQAFCINTELLKSLDDTFWTAKTMVAMAEQVLQEMDKAVASLAHETGIDCSKTPALGSIRGDKRTTTNGEVASAATDQDHLNGPINDWSLLETVPDLDVFGYFDPTFDLGAVDAALDGNLDFGASSNWFDWQQHWG